MPIRTVALLNESFPPLVDGVSTVMFNYAKILQRDYVRSVVVVPTQPGAEDDYDFEVLRMQSFSPSDGFAYRVANPFNPRALNRLRAMSPDVLHVHTPAAFALSARLVRLMTGKPIVLTYHTKFTQDLESLFPFRPMRELSRRFLLSNVKAADEVWVCSRGAVEDLRKLGYKGGYVHMPNGVDFSCGRVSDDEVRALRAEYGLDPEKKTLLFVGRVMWYKGLRLILDSLAETRRRGEDYQLLVVGDGLDREEIEAYANGLGLEDVVRFAGTVDDRARLRAHFCAGDLFVFPSTYDTAGIVVQEAAACEVPTMTLRGSAPAIGIEDGENGYLCENKANDMADRLVAALADSDALRAAGRKAQQDLYLSWDDVVARAWDRYHVLYRLLEEERPASATRRQLRKLRALLSWER